MKLVNTTLRVQLQKIQDEIIAVLKEKGRPLTGEELVNYSKLPHISEFGWSFSLDKLEKKKLIKYVGDKVKLN